jgi:peroxiredoxin
VDLLPRGNFELNAEMRRFREMRNRELPHPVTGAMDKATAELVDSYFTDLVVTVGEAAPPFSLPDARGRKVSLGDLLLNGPVVLVFYRGLWCPFCNIHLRALQSVLPQITDLGATLVAVSGQTPDKTLATVERNDIDYPVLSDAGLTVARSYGLAFELPDYLREVYSGLGHPVPAFNGTSEHTLPIPGTFVIDTGAVVRFAHADPDYRYRADPADILAALREVVR